MLDNFDKSQPEWDLSQRNIDYANVDQLIEALKEKKDLTYLSLCNNKINKESLAKIVNALEENNQLEYLNLGSNDLKDECVDSIVKIIQKHSSLKSLYLSYNKLSDQGLAKIAEALKSHHVFELIDLGFNENISDSSANIICDLLKDKPNLKSLSLAGNKITHVGVAQIEEVLKVNAKLESLDLSYNQLGDEGAKLVARALNLNTCLQSLYLLDKNRVMQCLNISQNNAISRVYLEQNAKTIVGTNLSYFECPSLTGGIESFYNRMGQTVTKLISDWKSIEDIGKKWEYFKANYPAFFRYRCQIRDIAKASNFMSDTEIGVLMKCIDSYWKYYAYAQQDSPLITLPYELLSSIMRIAGNDGFNKFMIALGAVPEGCILSALQEETPFIEDLDDKIKSPEKQTSTDYTMLYQAMVLVLSSAAIYKLASTFMSEYTQFQKISASIVLGATCVYGATKCAKYMENSI